MGCKVYNVYAPGNGERSKLYADLVDISATEEEALFLYSAAYTKGFKNTEIGDWTNENYTEEDKAKYLDENGEPKVEFVVGQTKEALLADKAIYDSAKKKAKAYSIASEKMVAYKNKMFDALTRRISELSRSKSTHADSILTDLEKLKTNLESLDWREMSSQFSEEAAKTIHYSVDSLQAEIDKDSPDPKRMVRLLNYLVAFDVLDELADEIGANPQMSSTMKTELAALNELVALKNKGKKKFNSYLEEHIASELSKLSAKYSEEDIMEFLKLARFDISSPGMLTRFLGDSKDPILALTAKLVNEKQQKTRDFAIDLNIELTELLEAVEKEDPTNAGTPEKLYSRILERDSKGELTGNVIGVNSKQLMELELQAPDSALLKFYRYYTKVYAEANDKLPANYRLEKGRLPGILKSGLEILKTSENKSENLKSYMSDLVKRSNLDTNKGELTDDAQRAVKKVPIFFTQSYRSQDYEKHYKAFTTQNAAADEETIHSLAVTAAKKDFSKVVSFDLARSISMFSKMAENYNNMMDIVDVVEGTKYMVHSRKVMVADSKGKVLLNKLAGLKNQEQLKDGAESNSYKAISDFIDMQVYGLTEDDLGDVLGVDKNKIIKLMMKSNSTLMLGLNVMGGTTNKIMGEINNLSESAGGELYSFKHYKQAIAKYNKEMGDLFADASRRLPTNIINLLNEKYDVLGDYRPEGATSEDSSTFKRLLNSSSLFFLQSAGEHSIQSKVAMAAMLGIETFNKEGVSTGNLYDAHEVNGRKLQIKPDTYIVDRNTGELVLFNTEQQHKLSRNIQATLRRVHGNYNAQTAAAWQKNGYLQLLGQFRKWIPEGIARRYNDQAYNEFADRETKGMYSGFGLGLKNLVLDLKQQGVLAGANWDKMSPVDKANFHRTTVEAAFFVAMGTVFFAAKALAESIDDDDEYKKRLAALRMATLMSNRIIGELTFYANPFSTLQILRTPAASMSVIEATTTLIYQALPWNINERYVTGDRKGDLKVINRLSKVVPIWKQVGRLLPEGIKDQYQYLNMQ